ncbi:hypothetical protein RJT34_04102 [Clitoria ternatea]|uniref:Uncharacterized protein n=1 Tax=Clitoria ternatea TaxID=43366 RepID=A0AAN9KLZ0_CLITE
MGEDGEMGKMMKVNCCTDNKIGHCNPVLAKDFTKASFVTVLLHAEVIAMVVVRCTWIATTYMIVVAAVQFLHRRTQQCITNTLASPRFYFYSVQTPNNYY